MPIWRRKREEFYTQLPIDVREFLEICDDELISTTGVALIVKMMMKENDFSQSEKSNVESLYKFLNECRIGDGPDPKSSLPPGIVIRRITPEGMVVNTTDIASIANAIVDDIMRMW